MCLGTLLPAVGVAIRNGLSQAPQPGPRPSELDAQYCQTYGNDDERWSWRHQHDDADQENGRADHAHDDTPSRLVRNVKCSSYHSLCRSLESMKSVRASILALFLSAVATLSLPAQADSEIVLAAQETEVRVEPRAPHLRLVTLPSLEFALRAAFRCIGDAVSLTISVSDTAKTLSMQELVDRRSAELLLAVPARQFAMADSGAFCVIDKPDSANEMKVAGFATAAASLRCSNEGKDSVRYASAPLTVRLVCARAENQEPAAPSADR